MKKVLIFAGNHYGTANEYQLLDEINDNDLQEFFIKNNIRHVFFEFLPNDNLSIICQEKTNLDFATDTDFFCNLKLPYSLVDLGLMSYHPDLDARNIKLHQAINEISQEPKTNNFCSLVKAAGSFKKALDIFKELILDQAQGDPKALNILGENMDLRVKIADKMASIGVQVHGLETVASYRENCPVYGATLKRLPVFNNCATKIILRTLRDQDCNALVVVGNGNICDLSFSDNIEGGLSVFTDVIKKHNKLGICESIQSRIIAGGINCNLIVLSRDQSQELNLKTIDKIRIGGIYDNTSAKIINKQEIEKSAITPEIRTFMYSAEALLVSNNVVYIE